MTLKALAVGLRTIRKNLYLAEHGIVPKKIEKYRSVRRGVCRQGIEIPTAAIKKMLSSQRLTNNGSAVAEIFKVAVLLGAFTVTEKARGPHYDQNTKKKLVDGFCACYSAGPCIDAVFAAGDELMSKQRRKLEKAAEQTPPAGAASAETFFSFAKWYRVGNVPISPPNRALTASAKSNLSQNSAGSQSLVSQGRYNRENRSRSSLELG